MQPIEVLSLVFNLSCIFILGLLILYWLIGPILSAPFLVSSTKDLLKMFDLVDLDREDTFVDLGSGDGRAVLAASRVCKYAVGVEINPFLTLFARFMAIMSANGEIKFKHKSYWDENLTQYNVVFIYLVPSEIEKLKHKLETELTPGSRVVTNKFKIKGWKHKKSAGADKENSKYYLYEIGKHS